MKSRASTAKELSERMEPILLERRGRVGLVRLNRPEKLNALNSHLVDRLEQALQQLDADEDIGAIVEARDITPVAAMTVRAVDH